jgi:hypothetical protein
MRALENLELLTEYLDCDCTSPSGLRWIKKPNAHIAVGKPAGWITSTGYYRVTVCGLAYRATHVVLLLNGVYPPLGCTEVDHIDRDPCNNRLSNLRWTNRSRNLSNRKVLGCVSYRYVHQSRGKYTAQYTHPKTKRQVFAGRFSDALSAHLAATAHRLENHWIDS